MAASRCRHCVTGTMLTWACLLLSISLSMHAAHAKENVTIVFVGDFRGPSSVSTRAPVVNYLTSLVTVHAFLQNSSFLPDVNVTVLPIQLTESDGHAFQTLVHIVNMKPTLVIYSGSDEDGVCTTLAGTLGHEGIPILSIHTHSTALSDRRLYPTHFRGIPADKDLACAHVAMILRLGHTDAQLVSLNTLDVQVSVMQQCAQELGLTLTQTTLYPSSPTDEQFTQMFTSMAGRDQARVIILCGSFRAEAFYTRFFTFSRQLLDVSTYSYYPFYILRPASSLANLLTTQFPGVFDGAMGVSNLLNVDNADAAFAQASLRAYAPQLIPTFAPLHAIPYATYVAEMSRNVFYLTYSLTKAAMLAIERVTLDGGAASNRTAVLETLTRTSIASANGGLLSFNTNGDADMLIGITQIQGLNHSLVLECTHNCNDYLNGVAGIQNLTTLRFHGGRATPLPAFQPDTCGNLSYRANDTRRCAYCPLGEWNNPTDGIERCTICPYGFYLDSRTCKPCPAGTRPTIVNGLPGCLKSTAFWTFEVRMIATIVLSTIVLLLCTGCAWVRSFNAEKRAQEDASFVEFVFHEVRNPINAVVGYLQLLHLSLAKLQDVSGGVTGGAHSPYFREQFATPAEKFRFMGMALGSSIKDVENSLEACRHAVDVLNHCVDMGRLSNRSLKLLQGRLDLRDICNKVVHIVQGVNSNITCSASVKVLPTWMDSDLENTQPVEVLGDEIRLKQVLLNLMSNAARLTSQGFVRLDVVVELPEGSGSGPVSIKHISSNKPSGVAFNNDRPSMSGATEVKMNVKKNQVMPIIPDVVGSNKDQPQSRPSSQPSSGKISLLQTKGGHQDHPGEQKQNTPATPARSIRPRSQQQHIQQLRDFEQEERLSAVGHGPRAYSNNQSVRIANVTFSIMDTGIGIKPADQKRILEADRSATKTNGIGLILSQEIVRLMGSRIQIDSPWYDGDQLVQGSKFFFTARMHIPPPLRPGTGQRKLLSHKRSHSLRGGNSGVSAHGNTASGNTNPRAGATGHVSPSAHWAFLNQKPFPTRQASRDEVKGQISRPMGVGTPLPRLPHVPSPANNNNNNNINATKTTVPPQNAGKEQQNVTVNVVAKGDANTNANANANANASANTATASSGQHERENGVATTMSADKSASANANKIVAVPSNTIEMQRSSAPLAAASRPQHILMAEDNPFNYQLLSRMIGLIGHHVTGVHNGLEAIAACNKAYSEGEMFDMLLIDIHMPEMNGIEVTENLRADDRFKTVPVIAVTASVFSSDLTRYENVGITDILAKPVTLKVLKDTIDRHSNKSSSKVVVHANDNNNTMNDGSDAKANANHNHNNNTSPVT